MVAKGGSGGRNKFGIDIHIIHATDNQQGPTVQHRELYSISRNKIYKRKESGKKQIYACITQSLCCTPETNTTLLVLKSIVL